MGKVEARKEIIVTDDMRACVRNGIRLLLLLIGLNVVLQAQPTGQAAAQNTTESNAQHDWLYQLYLVSGPVVVIVTLATAFVVWRQVVSLRTIERAWITVNPQKGNPGLFTIPVGGDVPLNVFDVSIKNVGKTPARLTQIALKYVRIKV